MSFSLPVILTLIGLSLSVLIPVITHVLKARKENRLYYSTIWEKSSKLKPKDILGERPYFNYYYERSEDTALKKQIESRHNVLITGPPLAGKSRAVYQQLSRLKKKAYILIPRNVAMSALVFPVCRKFWRDKIIFIDDLQYFMEKHDNYPMLLRKAKEKNISIITTCHTGQQFKKVKNKLIEQNLDLETIFSENIIEYSKITLETAKDIAVKMNIELNKIKFNGTVGSIFMRLSEMERRFDSSDNIEKTIMNSIRMMYISGLWENNNYSLEWIKLTGKKFDLEGKDFEWSGWLRSLEGKEFIKITRRDKIWAEDAYLQYIVKPVIEISDREIIDEMIDIFSNDTTALMMIGENAYNTGIIDIEITEYMRISIKAFSLALQNLNTENKLIFAKACEYLGLCHLRLALLDDVKENCTKSLHYFNEALRIINSSEYPLYYVRLQNELGNTYTALADIQDRIQNCKKAIECYNESLKYFSPVEYPVQFAACHHYLGGAYFTLSQEEDNAKNIKFAIDSLKKALTIRTVEQYPREYALTNNNLGNCYANLSDTENKKENLKLSIEHFNNILKVYDKVRRPLNFATTLVNLGNVYSMLAVVEDFDINIKKSLDMLNESLEIRLPDKFPLQYAAGRYSLGDVYLTLAKKKRNAEYCYKALDSLNDCLTIRTFDKYPLQYALTQNLLGGAYAMLGELEENPENYRIALNAYEETLRVYTEKSNPLYYREVRESISKIKKHLL